VGALPDLHAREVAAGLAEARAAYPGVALADAEFLEHVGAKLAAVDGAALRMRDLFLARAAAGRDPLAIALLEESTFGEIDLAYRRFPGLPASLDDVKQRLREKLFLATPPGILAYAGTGALRSWVRASALHMLLNIARRETREEPSDAPLLEVVIGREPSAEAAYMKLACREPFEAALTWAIEQLSDRERGLLRHAFVDGRNVDEVGAIYGVHRATAARWIAGARARLVQETRTELMRRLGISEVEAQSIIVAALSGVGSILLARVVR
jgi:RNA polymerase sigma-70 factor (ECF subfamily)